MMALNMTEINSISTVTDMIIFTNNHTNGLLFSLVTVGVFFALLLTLKGRWEFDEALAAASFASFFLSFALVYAQLLNFYVMIVYGVMLGLTVLYMFTAKNN